MIPIKKELWSFNTPAQFWLCQTDMPLVDLWQEAYQRSVYLLGLPKSQGDIEEILALTLGEARFGPRHWQLNLFKKAYYTFKPAIPRYLILRMRQLYNHVVINNSVIPWPIESRYTQFLWNTIQQFMILSNKNSIVIKNLWPDNNRFAFVLTHDIETKTGQDFVKEVANLDESLGFRSSFNFVPERYKLNYDLMNELRERGFEVGVHGLKHDGKLFDSHETFTCQAKQINHYIKTWGARGFRADMMFREPEWMQTLGIEYDLSFFDTDPFEPIPGGSMSIWPFFLGHFIELPYTLAQDYTLVSLLNKTSPKIWLDKVDYIEKYHGMALLNSHPDYLKQKTTWNIYHQFLVAMRKRENYWHALPHTVANWWKNRSTFNMNGNTNDLASVILDNEGIHITPY